MAASTGNGGTETQVLIAGAGPVGLSLGIDPARRGVAIRIIDTLAEPTGESRAIVVHSRTLDHFAALGVLDEIMAKAIISNGMEVHSGGRTIAAVEFDHIDAVHPYSVSLVQSESEAVLMARLQGLGSLPLFSGTSVAGCPIRGCALQVCHDAVCESSRALSATKPLV